MSDEAAAQPEPETTGADANETITIPVAEYEAGKRDVAEWKDRCLRNQAEFDNIRKRLRKEADEAGVRAVARAVKPLLNEIDNLGRAIDSATVEGFNEFAQGVTLTRDNLRGALQGQGIEQIPCEGLFDPTVHEVIAEQEDATVPKGTILQVFRAGYQVKGQLVRTAQVVVAKAPAAPAAG